MRRRTLRGLLLSLAGVTLALAGTVATSAPSGALPTVAGVVCEAAPAADGGSLSVVVAFPGKPLRTVCVAPGGTGIDALRRAGFDPVVSGYGSVGGNVAVCALRDPIDGSQIGCAAGPDCLLCTQPDYWGYFPGYRYAAAGAGSTSPVAGSVEAWRFGRATTWSGARPSASEVCVPTPPPTTAPPATSPPATSPPDGGGGGSAIPTPGGTTPDAGGGPAPSAAPGATTTAPGDGPSPTSTSTSPSSAPVPDAGPEADDDVAGPVAPGGESDAATEVAGAVPPEGPYVVVDDASGSSGVVPVVATGSAVAVLGALALAARRRRRALDADPGGADRQ